IGVADDKSDTPGERRAACGRTRSGAGRGSVIQFGRPPGGRVAELILDAPAVFQPVEIVLRPRVAVLNRPAIPLRGRLVITPQARAAGFIPIADDVLGFGDILFGRLAIILQRLTLVPIGATTVRVHVAEILERLAEILGGCLLVPLDRLEIVAARALAERKP